MMQEVETLQEACHFFLNNSKGSVICIKGTERFEANTYSAAIMFYTDNIKFEKD